VRNFFQLLIPLALPIVSLSEPSALQVSREGKAYVLAATPDTVAWGYYDAAASPVLRIHSGDTVTFHTLVVTSPDALEKAGVLPRDVPQPLRDIYAKVTTKGPGPHILNGPVYIEEAEPGDALEVQIQKIDLAIPYAYNAFRPNLGFLPEAFPYGRTKIIPLDRDRRLAIFSNEIQIPLHPFFGSMGVAPPEVFGRVNSIPPGVHGGNMDNKELVAGTKLFLPVHVRGALFEVGDGHAGQGNGEVDLTALETSLVGTLRFVIHKNMTLRYPRAETPTHYISMGFHQELYEAAHIAVSEMIDFLAVDKTLSREDAYMLISVCGDVDITELVDGNKGVHVMLPKSIFKAGFRVQ
jgi:acetamidase/formamidase